MEHWLSNLHKSKFFLPKQSKSDFTNGHRLCGMDGHWRSGDRDYRDPVFQ
jgi:hypothetical protein